MIFALIFWAVFSSLQAGHSHLAGQQNTVPDHRDPVRVGHGATVVRDGAELTVKDRQCANSFNF